jgi:hypothetical protein
VNAFEKQICAAVESGSLDEPFNAAMIRTACPGWEDKAYHIVLSEHAVGNGCTHELFERVSFGLYRLVRSPNGSESGSYSGERRDPGENAVESPTCRTPK